MDPGNFPVELSGLTQVEKILIARAASIMRVYDFEQIRGHFANVAQYDGSYSPGYHAQPLTFWSSQCAVRNTRTA